MKPVCFVIFPFSPPFEHYYKEIYAPAVEAAGCEARRVDEMVATRAIISDIFQEISKSRVVLAELTSLNPNVVYELGVAHALRKPVVMVVQRHQIDEKKLPFDVHHLRAIPYNTNDENWTTSLRSLITQTVSLAIANIYDEAAYQVFSGRYGLAPGLNAIHNYCPVKEVKEALTQARSEVRILQTWIPDLSNFERDLLEALNRGCRIRILIFHPDSQFFHQRCQDLLRDGANPVVANLDELKRIYRSLSESEKDAFQVKLYNYPPVISIYATDATAFVGFFFVREVSASNPHLELDLEWERGNEGLSSAVMRHFDHIWDDEKTKSAFYGQPKLGYVGPSMFTHVGRHAATLAHMVQRCCAKASSPAILCVGSGILEPGLIQEALRINGKCNASIRVWDENNLVCDLVEKLARGEVIDLSNYVMAFGDTVPGTLEVIPNKNFSTRLSEGKEDLAAMSFDQDVFFAGASLFRYPAGSNSTITVEKQDITKESPPIGCFDLVVANFVTTNIYKTAAAMQVGSVYEKLLRATKSAGALLVGTSASALYRDPSEFAATLSHCCKPDLIFLEHIVADAKGLFGDYAMIFSLPPDTNWTEEMLSKAEKATKQTKCFDNPNVVRQELDQNEILNHFTYSRDKLLTCAVRMHHSTYACWFVRRPSDEELPFDRRIWFNWPL